MNTGIRTSATLDGTDLIRAVREVFHCLSPEDQRDLFATIQQLKAEAAECQADSIKDPELRIWAKGFAALENPAPHKRAAIDLPAEPEPNQ
jgi:hypothetical protein